MPDIIPQLLTTMCWPTLYWFFQAMVVFSAAEALLVLALELITKIKGSS